MSDRATNLAITISLVPEARGGPFVYWDGLEKSVESAAAVGFGAVEIFPPKPEAIRASVVTPLLSRHDLKLAAVGTGAGWVKHKLTLTSPDADERTKATAFVRSIIDAAGELGAPAIIGSMQGRWTDAVPRETALAWLADALASLGDHARRHGVPLLYEPLNRYETNMCNTLAQGMGLLHRAGSDNVKLLADLFHMNIEETDLAAALKAAAAHVGHIHLADSNRRPIGDGHLPLKEIAAAVRGMNYAGRLSAECLPLPDSDAAARRTMNAWRRYFAG